VAPLSDGIVEYGDEAARLALGGLASRLPPGASFHADCVLTERAAETAEERVRALIGEASEEMDVLVAAGAVLDIAEYLFRKTVRGEITSDAADVTARSVRGPTGARVVECSVVVVRHASPRPPVTVRWQRGLEATPAALERALTVAAVPPAITPDRLHALKPRLSPHARLQVTHAPDASGWAPLGCMIFLEAPVRRSLQAGTNLAMLLDACDGSRSARQLYDGFLSASDPQDDPTEARFADVLRRLVMDGYVMLDGSTADR
jgi:hypothetical protein